MKLIKTSLYSAITTFIRIASGFIANKIVAIFTGPAGVAVIGQFTNFVAIILTVSNGAINTGVVKYTAEYENNELKQKKMLSTALRISMFCSFFFGFFLFIWANYFSNLILKNSIYNNAIRVLGITIIFYSLNNLLISILNGKSEIKKYTIVNTFGSLVGLIFTVLLVYFCKIEGALYSIVLSQSIVFFITLFFVIKSNWFSWSYFKYSFDKTLAKKLGGFSLMALVSVFTAPVVQILLRDMVISKIGLDAAGYWQGMMKVSDGYLLLITTALSTYYLPKLSSLKEDKDLRNEILYGYKIIMPVVFISCLLIYFSRLFIIKLLYTNSFVEMEQLFLYQLIGDFFKIAAWLISYLMLAKAMTKLFIITEIVFSLTYLIFGYICVDVFGLIGLTIAFVINYFIYFIFMLSYFRKLIFYKNE
ncbi:O-antigen translocase [Flavobacterium sp. KACC 22763]|uniref:O-antigen translocase n=1 Tax=Flavobacterium sp. KACC 22763 TaxID=3025668 RepID=UPI002365F694|nr:O-antigen translocase [Flavobacterium sp. KACC 22763]WDF62899.1 O-antigen translocase [Flavobacterium sp. KACC 22763]